MRRIILFCISTMACAAFACAVFFALLSIWGIVAAPFVQLQSASFLIVCALAVSAAATVAAYGAFSRRLTRGRFSRRRR